MNFDHLRIFVAVAEREHVTRAAAALGYSPSAVSAAIGALERLHNVRLFSRVGRGIELTQAGLLLLAEARRVLSQVDVAKRALEDLGQLKRGFLRISASQTISSYWLPRRLISFQRRFPGVDIDLRVGNTRSVTADVVGGSAELGFIEGAITEQTVASTAVGSDNLVVVVSGKRRIEKKRKSELMAWFDEVLWVMREPGSGTRSEFEDGLRAFGYDPSRLRQAIALPSNEAVISALRAGNCAAAVSRLAVDPWIKSGALRVVDFAFRRRKFHMIRRKDRVLSALAREFARKLLGEAEDI